MSWRERAVCRGADINLFFPAKTGAVGRRMAVETVARFCARCPVRVECGDAGANELGIWGGRISWSLWTRHDQSTRVDNMCGEEGAA